MSNVNDIQYAAKAQHEGKGDKSGFLSSKNNRMRFSNLKKIYNILCIFLNYYRFDTVLYYFKRGQNLQSVVFRTNY